MSEIQRKLATISLVEDCFKHPNADRLNIVKVRGWQCVTTEMYQPGDIVVYFEIDSFLPIRPEFEFLRKSCYRNIPELGEGFRIRTVRLRKELSQGLTLPFHVAFASTSCKGDWDLFMSMTALSQEWLQEGMDVTDYLGVKKFELPIPAQLMGQIEGSFPSFIHKTDQERIQNIYNAVMTDKQIDLSFLENVPKEDHQKILDRIAERVEHSKAVRNETFEASLKMDGSSCTLFAKRDPESLNVDYGVCSRNMQLKINNDNAENAFVMIANQLEDKVFVAQNLLQCDIAIQGELMGPGVQGNRENLKERKLFVFDIFDIDAQKYLPPFVVRDVCDQVGLTHVPVFDDNIAPFALGWTLEDFLRYADDHPSIGHQIAEGVVFKSNQSNFSFKVINNRFLEKEKD